ncbi:hypothetical protein QJ48_02900 [Paenibacillus sp. A3]|uniref:hypothetical protein n=1 Tax=Paenibacillus sp. A3 TaxID=1337054 RepID=UPI0006E5A23E|nr:hypothetical protein [Paenibacillus sp. A3]KPV60918.1 hypothetical protein QJ48_02900 [Paenibacillus sp. A3]
MRKLAPVWAAMLLMLPAIAKYPATSYADELSISFVIIGETNLYAREGGGGRPLGSISPYQNVLLAPGAPFSFYDERKPEEWLKVRTWLGDRWIRDDERVLYGTYEERRKTLTLLNTERLFDRPDARTDTGQSLAPQEIVTTAELHYGPKYVINATSASGQTGTWYQVETTWMGPKWILKPALMEDVHAKTVDYDLKLSGAEIAYEVPYDGEGKGEAVEPGIVHAIAKWQYSPQAFFIFTWYKVRLPQGERWIKPEHEVLEDYKALNEPVKLTTKTRYFEERRPSYDRNLWLEPGAYKAVQSVGDWTQLETPEGLKWVNLKRALLERPEGIVPIEETVKLTAETQTYWFPATGEMCHLKGFFTPQEVQAFERWTSPEGEVWYHIKTFSGTEWVKQ